VYSGYLRDGHISNGWLYLGSGNLSRRGILTTAKLSAGNIECGVLIPVPERISVGEVLARRLFWHPDAAEIKRDEWRVGRVGDAPEGDAGMIAAAPILSASIVPEPIMSLRLLWRDDVPSDAKVSVAWAGLEWTAVAHAQATVDIQDRPVPVALRVRDDATSREWTIPVVDA